MFNMIRTAALSALVGLGALAAIPATAQADGIYLNFGRHGDPRVGVYDGDRDDGFRHFRRHHDRDRHHRDRRWRRGCSQDRALDKAERMGVRRARLVDKDRYTVKVAGRKHGDRVVLVFGNKRGCPLIRR